MIYFIHTHKKKQGQAGCSFCKFALFHTQADASHPTNTNTKCTFVCTNVNLPFLADTNRILTIVRILFLQNRGFDLLSQHLQIEVVHVVTQ